MAKHAGSGKAGKNKQKCEAYKAAGRRETNKKRRLAKHEARLARFADRFANFDPKNRGKQLHTCSEGTYKKRYAREFNRYAAANGGLTLTALHDMEVAFQKREAATD
jgi:hypothetical protein